MWGSSGIKEVVQICPCGCGFEHPIVEPLFSKICMYVSCGVGIPFPFWEWPFVVPLDPLLLSRGDKGERWER